MLPCTAEIEHYPEPALGASPGFTAQHRESLPDSLPVWLLVALFTAEQVLGVEAGKSLEHFYGQWEDNGAVSF